MESQAVRLAAPLLEPGTDRVAAEMLGSELLGSTWADAEPGERSPESALAHRFIGHVRSRPNPGGIALLAACALVAGEPLRHELEAAVAELGQVPAWAEGPVPAPTRAWLAEDPWGQQQIWFLRFDKPAEHLLVAAVVQPGGTEVISLMVDPPEALQDYDEIQAEVVAAGDVPARRREVPLAQALSELRDALIHTDLLWPREHPQRYTTNRLLVRRRVLAHAQPPPSLKTQTQEADELPGADREALITRFLAGQPPGADKDDTGHLVGLFLDYGQGHLHGGPLAWTPADVSLFLLDWLPRKAVVDHADREVLPALLAAWVRFALTERGLEERWIRVVVDAVQENTQDFHDGYVDPSLYGPARQFADWVSQAGVDLDDQAAMDTAVRQWNAQRLAQRQLTADPRGLPTGSAARVTIALLDVLPRVWRRIVVPAEVTLDQLHTVVQIAMGWEDDHLHQWESAGQRFGEPSDREITDERQVRLLSVASAGQSLDYLYDFGDGWAHRVTVDEILQPDVAGVVPRCEAGRRACPPEDIGGAYGYAELLAALANPTGGSDWEQELAQLHANFDPDRFDHERVSSMMRAYLRRGEF